MSVNLNNYKGKQDNTSTLSASEWNLLMDTLETGINNAGGSGETGSSYITSTTKGNITLTSPKNINLEPAYSGTTYGDIVFKPGDDIEILSHHRQNTAGENKTKQIMIKVNDGSGDGNTSSKPVELHINAKSLTMTTKDVPGTVGKDEEIFNVDINTGKSSGNNKKGYLKVRARAIDLRCEEHGGIALLPKGRDSHNNMNKIKFEHGGGDGLEFGTFNSEKTSIFTNEYRFNKHGIWKMAGRQTEAQTDPKKYDSNDNTTHYIYKKNDTTADDLTYEAADDFYDFIKKDDPQCTTEDLIKTAYAVNGGKNRHLKATKSKIELVSNDSYKWVPYTGASDVEAINATECIDVNKEYNDGDFEGTVYPDGGIYSIDNNLYVWTKLNSPEIQILSKADVTLESKDDDIVLNGGDTVKLNAPEIRLTADNLISLSTTPNIVTLSQKFKKTAKFEAVSTKLSEGILNNTSSVIYYDPSTGLINMPVEDIFTDKEGTNKITLSTADGTALYHNVNGLIVQCDKDSKYFTKIDGTAYLIVTKKGSGTLKINDTTECTLETNPGVSFKDHDYVKQANETEILPGEICSSQSVNISDIIKFVSWAKNNNFGPWAS